MNKNNNTNKRIKFKFFRELNAILTIAFRDILLMIKSPARLIVNLVMPLIMMGMLGGSLSQNMAGGLGFNYNQFLLVGMFVNTLFMMTTMGITSLVEDRSEDFTQEMFVSPVSRYSIALGKIIGASVGAIIQLVGLFVMALIMGITITFVQFISLLAIAPLMCLVAGSLGMIIVAFIKDNRMGSIITMVITFPQMFLSGVLIPINNSSGILHILSRIMPMTYCLDLTRAIFYRGTSEYSSIVLFNPVINLAVISVLTIVFLIIGTFFFARAETNR